MHSGSYPPPPFPWDMSHAFLVTPFPPPRPEARGDAGPCPHTDPLPPPPGLKPEEMQGHVELRCVKFAYPARPKVIVFRSFSLTILPGQTVALVGESGERVRGGGGALITCTLSPHA